jgi:hypothetical protein
VALSTVVPNTIAPNTIAPHTARGRRGCRPKLDAARGAGPSCAEQSAAGMVDVPKVRIVADYCSKGYILVDAPARACGELPVDAALAARIGAWADCYDAGCDPLAYEDVTGKRFDFVAFAAEGLAIARAVKRALPHWTVTYFDESLDWFNARDPRRYDPGRAEYEISLREAMAPSHRKRDP